MIDEHDNWLRSIGIDIDALRSTAKAALAPSAGNLADGAAHAAIDGAAGLAHDTQ